MYKRQVITKSNAQRHAMVMWDEIAVQLAAEFPDVRWDKELVDAATCLLYTSDAADDMQCVDLGGRRIIKKKKRA